MNAHVDFNVNGNADITFLALDRYIFAAGDLTQ